MFQRNDPFGALMHAKVLTETEIAAIRKEGSALLIEYCEHDFSNIMAVHMPANMSIYMTKDKYTPSTNKFAELGGIFSAATVSRVPAQKMTEKDHEINKAVLELATYTLDTFPDSSLAILHKIMLRIYPEQWPKQLDLQFTQSFFATALQNNMAKFAGTLYRVLGFMPHYVLRPDHNYPPFNYSLSKEQFIKISNCINTTSPFEKSDFPMPMFAVTITKPIHSKMLTDPHFVEDFIGLVHGIFKPQTATGLTHAVTETTTTNTGWKKFFDPILKYLYLQSRKYPPLAQLFKDPFVFQLSADTVYSPITQLTYTDNSELSQLFKRMKKTAEVWDDNASTLTDCEKLELIFIFIKDEIEPNQAYRQLLAHQMNNHTPNITDLATLSTAMVTKGYSLFGEPFDVRLASDSISMMFWINLQIFTLLLHKLMGMCPDPTTYKIYNSDSVHPCIRESVLKLECINIDTFSPVKKAKLTGEWRKGDYNCLPLFIYNKAKFTPNSEVRSKLHQVIDYWLRSIPFTSHHIFSPIYAFLVNNRAEAVHFEPLFYDQSQTDDGLMTLVSDIVFARCLGQRQLHDAFKHNINLGLDVRCGPTQGHFPSMFLVILNTAYFPFRSLLFDYHPCDLNPSPQTLAIVYSNYQSQFPQAAQKFNAVLALKIYRYLLFANAAISWKLLHSLLGFECSDTVLTYENKTDRTSIHRSLELAVNQSKTATYASFLQPNSKLSIKPEQIPLVTGFSYTIVGDRFKSPALSKAFPQIMTQTFGTFRNVFNHTFFKPFSTKILDYFASRAKSKSISRSRLPTLMFHSPPSADLLLFFARSQIVIEHTRMKFVIDSIWGAESTYTPETRFTTALRVFTAHCLIDPTRAAILYPPFSATTQCCPTSIAILHYLIRRAQPFSTLTSDHLRKLLTAIYYVTTGLSYLLTFELFGFQTDQLTTIPPLQLTALTNYSTTLRIDASALKSLCMNGLGSEEDIPMVKMYDFNITGQKFAVGDINRDELQEFIKLGLKTGVPDKSFYIEFVQYLSKLPDAPSWVSSDLLRS